MTNFLLSDKTGTPVVIPIITEWVAYTPTLGGMTIAASSLWWKRVGSDMLIQGFIDISAAAAALAKISIPLGLNANTSFLAANQKNEIGYLISSTGSGTASLPTFYAALQIDSTDTTNIRMSYQNATDASGNVFIAAQNASTMFAATAQFTVKATIPILEWAGSPSGAFGSGQATATKLGIVMGGTVPGRIDGTTVAPNYIGEILEATGSAVSLGSNTYSDGGNAGITCTPGIWMIQAIAQFAVATTTVVSGYLVAIGTVSGNSSSGQIQTKNTTQLDFTGQTTVGNRSFNDTHHSPNWVVNLSASQQYWPKAQSLFTTSTMTVNCAIRAVRIG